MTWRSCHLWFDKWFWGDLTFPGEPVEHVQLPHGSASGQLARLFVLLSSRWVSGAGDGWDATQVACQRLSTIGYFTTNYRFSGFPVAFTLEPIHWYGWWSHHWFPSLRIPVVLLVCWFMNTYIYGIIVTVLLSRYSSMIPLINPGCLGCLGWWIHSPRSHKG